MLIKKFNQTEIGVHLHSTPETRIEKIEAAYAAGCNRFDSALKGFGGCPMAADDLTGNLATEDLIYFLEGKQEKINIDVSKWHESMLFSQKIFTKS